MPSERTNARIGDLKFDLRYADPVVDVDTESNTVEKQTVNDEIVVQNLGRAADRIHIEGIILEDDVGSLDTLVQSGEVKMRTQRYAGTVIVLSTSSDYTHSYDIAPPEDAESEWLYSVTIDCIEVEEIPSRAIGSAESGGGGGAQIVT